MILQNREKRGEGCVNTHAELNGDREVVAASLLGDLGTTRDAGKVDVAGLDETLGTLDGFEELLSESVLVLARFRSKTHNGRLILPVASIGHGQSGRTSTILGLDNLITTKLDAWEDCQ